jgi:rfaE bifunctional protein nucleotidyltransferase chain/domain
MIVSRELLINVCKELKNQGKKLVFTNGCFDILHSGHVTYLQKAKQLGDVLILGLNTDESVHRIKGASRPINNETDRGIVIDSLSCIDFVTLFNEETPQLLIDSIIPDVLVKGGDYTVETIIGANTVIKNGGQVITIQLVEGKSTTNIINKMKS